MARIRMFYDAVTGGDFDRVKSMLAEDPDLLFAHLEDLASPAREALHAGHQDITDFLAREELRRLEEGRVPRRHLYGAIHDLGEVAHAETGYPLADQLRAVAEPVVGRFLKHEDERLRYIALMVLSLHWSLRSYRDTYAAMMFGDSDDEVRRIAVASLGSVLESSRDWDATRDLLKKLGDREEDISVREEAYEALITIWFGFDTSFKWFLKVMEAQRPFEQAEDEAGRREDWEESVRLHDQADRVWATHVDKDFVAALERGEEPGELPSF